MAEAERAPRIQALVLDAAPLLTQAKIQGLAKKYYIPPSVLAELRDVRAREFLERLHTTGQIDLEVREPGAEAMRKSTCMPDTVIDFAKQTGDYAVLSPADMHVLALTYALEVETHGTWRIRESVGGKACSPRLTQTGQQLHEERRLQEKAGANEHSAHTANDSAAPDANDHERSAKDSPKPAPEPSASAPEPSAAAAASEAPSEPPAQTDDGFTVVDAQHGFQPHAPSEPTPRPPAQLEDEGEDDETVGGEWITPSNITQHKNKALGLVVEESQPMDGQSSGRRRRGKKRSGGNLSVACMTGDFAVQNVLLQMGLRLVSVDGVRIERVKSWVLRCHACYKYVAHRLTQNLQGCRAQVLPILWQCDAPAHLGQLWHAGPRRAGTPDPPQAQLPVPQPRHDLLAADAPRGQRLWRAPQWEQPECQDGRAHPTRRPAGVAARRGQRQAPEAEGRAHTPAVARPGPGLALGALRGPRLAAGSAHRKAYTDWQRSARARHRTQKPQRTAAAKKVDFYTRSVLQKLFVAKLGGASGLFCVRQRHVRLARVCFPSGGSPGASSCGPSCRGYDAGAV